MSHLSKPKEEEPRRYPRNETSPVPNETDATAYNESRTIVAHANDPGLYTGHEFNTVMILHHHKAGSDTANASGHSTARPVTRSGYFLGQRGKSGKESFNETDHQDQCPHSLRNQVL